MGALILGIAFGRAYHGRALRTIGLALTVASTALPCMVIEDALLLIPVILVAVALIVWVWRLTSDPEPANSAPRLSEAEHVRDRFAE